MSIKVFNKDFYKGYIDTSFLDYKKYLMTPEEIDEIKNKIPNKGNETSSDIHIIYSNESKGSGNSDGCNDKPTDNFDEKSQE